MKIYLRLVSVLGVMALCFSCVKNNTTSSTENESKVVVQVKKNTLESIMDSLLSVYPKTFENPIQQSDFLKALAEAITDLSEAERNKMIEQIPFKLYQVQNVANQPGNKYLTAFEFSERYRVNNEPEGDYATIDEGYEIQIYVFSALDKASAGQLGKDVKYKLSGESKIVEAPTIGGWDDRTINLGFEILDASISQID